MNIFVLNTGRCGSTTFIEACKHITNFSSAHESRAGRIGHDRFAYPENHIEADNRLSWFLGRLNQHYGNDAFYVHLKRDEHDTAKSYAKRLFRQGIIRAYSYGILIGSRNAHGAFPLALDYCTTVNSNIELFLHDKTQKMVFNIEDAKQDFLQFWNLVGAEGDLEAALMEFDVNHNASKVKKEASFLEKVMRKGRRLVAVFPEFIKEG